MYVHKNQAKLTQNRWNIAKENMNASQRIKKSIQLIRFALKQDLEENSKRRFVMLIFYELKIHIKNVPS